MTMHNALTIDVEDYYMVSAFSDVVSFEDWHIYESRVENNTCKILDLLNEYGVKATFFVLGWVAEHYPSLIKSIHNSGHEVASHGYSHRLIYNLTPNQFRDDIRKAKFIIEDIIGTAVKGYRAASYSIVKRTLWALDILIEEGFQYDSSIFPIHHDRYGLPGAERFPHIIKRTSGAIMEFPPSTYQVFGQNIPVAGGGYLRLFPARFTKRAIKKINEKDKNMAIVYLHPWEIDVNQPKLCGCWKSRLRHYINLDSTLPKLKILLNEFRFKTLAEFTQQSESFKPHKIISPAVYASSKNLI